MSEPVSSRELGPISPSLLTRLACPLRIAFEQSLTGGTSTSSDEAVLGSVAHRAIELALKGRDLDEAWSESCEEERARTDADPRTYAAARRTLLRLQKHVPRLLELLSSMSESERLLETWFETPDSALGGKPDLVVVRGDNTAAVIDYKTGLVTSDDGVKSAYIRQLLFYGALVYECLHAVPVILALLSLREGVVQVEPTSEGMAEVAAEARASRSEFNGRVPGAQPANASEENCQWCPFAAQCEAFWQGNEPHWVSSVGEAVRGTVETEPEHAASGVTTLQLLVSDGHLTGSMAIVAGIPTELVAHVGVGSVVGALDLRIRSEDPLVLTWTNRASALTRVAVR